MRVEGKTREEKRIMEDELAIGKIGEEIFREYRIDKHVNGLSSTDNYSLMDVTDNEEWQHATDIDFISGIKEGNPVFHEVKTQPEQYTSKERYFNLLIEAISTSSIFKCKHDNKFGHFNIISNRTDCELCPDRGSCTAFKRIHAPQGLRDILKKRGESDNYRDQYSIKNGDGYYYKNYYIHADWIHFYLPFVYLDENGNTEKLSIVKELSEEKIQRWIDSQEAKAGGKLIARLPSDVVISIKYDFLKEKLLENDVKYGCGNACEYTNKRTGKKQRAFYLPIVALEDDMFNCYDSIHVTPIFEYYDEKGNIHRSDKFTGYYAYSSMLQKVGITDARGDIENGEWIMRGASQRQIKEFLHKNYKGRTNVNETPLRLLLHCIPSRLKVIFDRG